MRFFSQYGEVLGAKSVPDKCCGFVQFAQRMNAEAAFVMDKQMMAGTRIRISWSRTQLVVRQPQQIQHQPTTKHETPKMAPPPPPAAAAATTTTAAATTASYTPQQYAQFVTKSFKTSIKTSNDDLWCDDDK